MPNTVHVVGSINMDVVALAVRHPMTGETIKGSDLKLLPGGKGANQAVASRRAGAATSLIGCLGDDAFAAPLREFLSNERVDLSAVREVAGSATGTALITVAGGDNTIVVVPGANDAVGTTDLPEAFAAGDVVVAQFETPQETTAAAFAAAREVGAQTVLNPAPADELAPGLLELVDVLVVNETEAAAVLAIEVDQISADQIGTVESLTRHETRTTIITLGAAGALVVSPTQTVHIPGRAVSVVDTTGAGDCFVGNVAAGLAAGIDVITASHRANVASSLCVQQLGAGRSMPTSEEVEAAK